MINFNHENINQTRKKNSKHKTGIDYNEQISQYKVQKGCVCLKFTNKKKLRNKFKGMLVYETRYSLNPNVASTYGILSYFLVLENNIKAGITEQGTFKILCSS